MSDRKNYYFRQKVTESELDGGFEDLEQADWNFSIDSELYGIMQGLVVTEKAGTPDLSVDVSGPGTAYTKNGERCQIASTQNVDVSQDDGGTPTTVSTPGNTKVVSVFIDFDRSLSDPRTDGNGNTVYFEVDESYQFSVIQGSEALIGTEVPPPLASDKILLADIRMLNGGTQILNATTVGAYDQIDFTRREDTFANRGGTVEIVEGTGPDAVASLLTALNNHIDAVANQHPASEVTCTDTDTWADGTTLNGATVVDDVQEALSAIVDDLASQASGNDGAGKIGAYTQTVGGETVPTGDIASQILNILSSLNGKGTLSGSNTWTGSNAFNSTFSTNNQLDFTARSSSGGIVTPAIHSTPSATSSFSWVKTLVLHYEASGTTLFQDTRIYINSGKDASTTNIGRGIDITINCYWDHSTSKWVQDNAGATSEIFHFGDYGFKQSHKVAGASDWDDDDWDDDKFDVKSDILFKDLNTLARLSSGKLQFGPVSYGSVPFTRMHLIDITGQGSSQREAHVYYNSGKDSGSTEFGAGIEISINCEWDSSTSKWAQIDTGSNSFLYSFTYEGFKTAKKYASSGAGWSDTGWNSIGHEFVYPNANESAIITTSGILEFGGAVSGAYNTASNINQGTTPRSNTYYAKNCPKAWGYVEVDASGNVTTTDGFNIATPSNPGANTYIDIVFNNALANANYSVVPAEGNSFGPYIFLPTNLATTGFTLYYYQIGSGFQAFNANVDKVMFQVFGTD